MAEPLLRIGYALAPKKQQSFIRPSLLTLAAHKGIDLVQIDPSLPLIQQGPLDCILHKIYGHDWNSQLQEYSAVNPKSLVIDSPEEISRLHNRVSMLQAVEELTRGRAEELTRGTEEKEESFGVPRQIVIYDYQTLVNRRSD